MQVMIHNMTSVVNLVKCTPQLPLKPPIFLVFGNRKSNTIKINQWNNLDFFCIYIQVLGRALTEAPTSHLMSKEHKFVLDSVFTVQLKVSNSKCDLVFAIRMTLQMLLWSMAKSPLMYGGDLRHLDDDTFNLITHPTLLKINHHSENNKEVN
jgi:hypothetical protein